MSAAWALLGRKEWVYPLVFTTSVVVAVVFLLYLNHAVYTFNKLSIGAITGIVLVSATPSIWLHTTSGLESGVFGLGLALLAYLALFGDNHKQQYITIFF